MSINRLTVHLPVAQLPAAAVTMAATLLSFGSVLALKHAAGLTSSSVVLAVVLALTLSRSDRLRHGGVRARLIAPLVLPLLAVGASEIGQRMFTRPDLGDTLFVLGMAAAIWLRRFGPLATRTGALLSTALIATLVVPGPIVPIGSGAPNRWWAALVALIALAWVTLTQQIGQSLGLRSPTSEAAATSGSLPARTPKPGEPWYRRLPASTRMATQMALALGAAFAAGRGAFGPHWTWAVLTAYIVTSGNRGRGDVVHKAVMRVIGAAVGTLAATAIANVFAPGNDWSIICLFGVLGVALWLRTINYAFWAGGVTAALALLYGYYGETGDHLLLTRLSAIGIGATIAVAVAWLVFPIRNVDLIRRGLSIALATLGGALAARRDALVLTPEEVARFRTATAYSERAAGSLRWLAHLPTAWQRGLPYAVASGRLAACGTRLDGPTGHARPLTAETAHALRAEVTTARRALATSAAEANPANSAALVEAITRIASVLTLLD